MPELDVWADPDFAIGGEYVKFDTPGDTVTGKVIAVRKHVWDDGSVSPQLLLDVDGEEKTVTAGQVRLKAALAEKRPQPGQTVTITYEREEKRAGGKTLKHFDENYGDDPFFHWTSTQAASGTAFLRMTYLGDQYAEAKTSASITQVRAIRRIQVLP